MVARGNAKAKFKAVAHGICEGLWIKQLLEELKMTSPKFRAVAHGICEGLWIK